MSEHKIRIAIAGGGIAGLALAAGLTKKPHLEVHVYESVAQYADIGAGLAIHLNGIKAMSLIAPDLVKAYQDKGMTMGEEDQEIATQLILAQGPHVGKMVAELGRAKGRKTVSRADLLDGFRALVPAECISFGKRLVEIAENPRRGIEITFADGTSASADCLLGADGIHSVTRSHLLGPNHPATSPKNHDGWQIYRTMVSMDEARKQIKPQYTTTVSILLGPKGHINCIPLNQGTRLSAGVAVRGAKFTPDGKAPELDPELYNDYSEDAQQIVRMVARDTSASWTAADHDHAPFYSRRCVAIFGDAAHAALPFAGNGAAQALEDAAVLNALFEHVFHRSSVEYALAAFSIVRRPRSQAVVEVAREFGRLYAFALDGVHEDPVRMRGFLQSMGAFMNDFDVAGQTEEALEIFWDLVREVEWLATP
ncbi:FAD/NAD(P)-binding domain-containing protein [Xylaria sp. CBS 124048]|nr:FAD/NAD(P)-binding domain-containing protein [Xylaria sp. CBS 124048]